VFRVATVTQEDPDVDRYQHTKVDGSAVVHDEVLLSGLGKAVGYDVPLKGTRELTLEDGRRVYACRDCDFLGSRTAVEDGVEVFSTRGDIRKHRSDKHGVPKSGPPRGRRRAAGEPAQEEELPLDDVDQAGLPYPDAAMRGLTLGELLEFAEHVEQWSRVYSTLQSDRDHWKIRATVAESELRKIRRMLGKLMPAGDGSDG
jgi:hypothetical protein